MNHKRMKLWPLAAALLGLTAIQAFGQTPTNTPPAAPPTGGLLAAGETIWSDLESATNYGVAPYLSFGLNNHKVGGGVLALYNFNNFIGAGIGADYLGSFSLVSGNVQLKLPLQPLQFTKWPWATNITLTPFVYTGIGTPLSGSGQNNGGVSTHIGVGDYITFGHLWGGRFEVGGAYITRSGAGAYSGKYANAFFSWSHGF